MSVKQDLLGATPGCAPLNESRFAGMVDGTIDTLAKLGKYGSIGKANREKVRLDKKLLKAEHSLEVLDQMLKLFKAEDEVVFHPFMGVSAYKSLIEDLKENWFACNIKQCRHFINLAELSERFVLFGDIPNIEELVEFADSVKDKGVLQMPYDNVLLEFEVKHAGKTFHIAALFDCGWDQTYLAIYRSDWYGWMLGFDDACNVNDETWLANIVKAFLILLVSRSSEIVQRDNRGRAAQASDEHAYRTVRVPAASITDSRDGTHASPRMHWRRGHIRRQRYGRQLCAEKIIWVAPVLVGERGWIDHEYSVAKA